jgi:hypothetical protein
MRVYGLEKEKEKKHVFFKKKRSMSERERWLEHERCEVFFLYQKHFWALRF